MPTIFMCYRRDDTRHVAGRVYDRLAARYGDGAVFRDLDDIPSGVDHIEASEAALRSAKAFVALIGKEWLTAKDNEGQLRIYQPGDRVRIEIELALKHDVAIFPVLVEGAAMPRIRTRDLPTALELVSAMISRVESPLCANPYLKRGCTCYPGAVLYRSLPTRWAAKGGNFRP